jgi:hypothetical protein
MTRVDINDNNQSSNMDFITVLAKKNKKHDSIMVVVDKLTKATHFISMKTTHKAYNVVDIYMREITCLHCIPKTIVSDKDPKFTSNFWRGLFKGLKMIQNFITTYHPESDGQTKGVNQVIKGMLRMYVMENQESLKMSPFEALYGRK